MRKPASAIAVHGILILYTALALFPILLVIMNSFKARKAIFGAPLTFPTPSTFSLIGYDKVFGDSSVISYYVNSITVTGGTIFFTLLFGAMAAWALTEYKFRWNTMLALFLAVGIMVPIRLGSVSIIQLIVELNLINTLTALILVYTAQNLPLSIFILSEFIAQIPKDLREAGRCDGLSEYNIFFYIVLPLIRPAMATVAVFTMIPVWNDLWFPGTYRRQADHHAGNPAVPGPVHHRLECGALRTLHGNHPSPHPLCHLFASIDPGPYLGCCQMSALCQK
jgi:raffinose/stachyose/melibiose transport system permease protein